MTSENTTKLIKAAADASHAYETADGRFLVYRPDRRDNGWSVEDTQRWAWRWSYRGLNEIVVRHDEVTCWSLADVREQIAKEYARGSELREGLFSTEAEARAAGVQYRAEQRRAAADRARAEAEASLHPAPGTKTVERMSPESYDIRAEDGRRIGTTKTVGDATLFAGAADLAESAASMLEVIGRFRDGFLPGAVTEAADALRAALAATKVS